MINIAINANKNMFIHHNQTSKIFKYNIGESTGKESPFGNQSGITPQFHEYFLGNPEPEDPMMSHYRGIFEENRGALDAYNLNEAIIALNTKSDHRTIASVRGKIVKDKTVEDFSGIPYAPDLLPILNVENISDDK